MDPKDLREPWLIAAWPGMGAVGLGAVTYLAKALGAHPLGELPTQGHFELDHLTVKEGVFQPARRPHAFLLGWSAASSRPGRPGCHDLVLLLGEAQPTSHAWEFAQRAIDVARELDVRRVVTFAAMASPIEPHAPPRVFAAASDRALLDEARRHELTSLEDGQIAGLNGLLVGAAAEKGIPGLCLLGEFPYFAGGYPNPRASAAVLRAFGRLSGVEVDLGPLDAEARIVEGHLVELQHHARDLAARHAGEPTRGDHPEEGDEAPAVGATTDEPQAPHLDPGARDHVESLFGAARADRSKALELKAELDRLGVFRDFEDRFLDLFKRAE